MDGIFNINKAVGMTSHDVVAKVRKLLKQRRVGHAGTLDPAASGVLPICIGQGTRVAEYLSESGKAYRAEVVFGVVTDTYDAQGVVIRTASTENLTLPKIEEVLLRFLGPQMQLPPRYSAIKLKGQPAYKLARAGEEVTLEPRAVIISELRVVEWTAPRLTLDVECSKGTYIRSLAYDLGEQLGCGAYLGGLVRTRSGPFSLAESISLEELAEAVETRTVERYLFPLDKAVELFPALVVDSVIAERVRHGNGFRGEVEGEVKEQGDSTHLVRVYDNDGQFLAIADWDAREKLWKPKKVFEV